MIPLDERLARRSGHYLHNTQQTRETNIHAVSGIRTRDPCNQVPQTYDLDRRASGIGVGACYFADCA
jgi:hypothetical protein